MDNTVKMVPATCTQCGGTVEVNKAEETATCPFCGATFIIEKAVNNYNVNYAKIEHADNVNIDARGAVKEVLGFVGEQMKESRQAKKEIRKIEAEKDKIITMTFFKIFGIMFAVMMVIALIISCVGYFTGGFGDDGQDQTVSEEGGSEMVCYLEDGYLYTDITGEGVPEWRYLESESTGTVLQYENNDADGYHSCVSADENAEGVYYVVAAAFNADSANNDPIYYSINKVTIEDSSITDSEDPVIVDSLSEYDFEK